MALFHCLAVVISSLLVVWIMEKVGMSIIDVLEKCGVSCLKKQCDFREDIEETLYCVQKMVLRNEMDLRMIKIKFTYCILLFHLRFCWLYS